MAQKSVSNKANVKGVVKWVILPAISLTWLSSWVCVVYHKLSQVKGSLVQCGDIIDGKILAVNVRSDCSE